MRPGRRQPDGDGRGPAVLDRVPQRLLRDAEQAHTTVLWQLSRDPPRHEVDPDAVLPAHLAAEALERPRHAEQPDLPRMKLAREIGQAAGERVQTVAGALELALTLA